MTRIPFAYEDELCAVLARHLDRVVLPTSNPSHIRTLAQRPIGTVVPDFIYVRSGRLVGSPPPAGLTALEAAIIATLMPVRSLRDVTIARRLYSRVERIAPRLRSLERLGILKETTEGVFALRRRALPKTAHVVAVEAKLRRWREAIVQAASYLGFANQSYVALPRQVIKNNTLLRTAAKGSRVGVLAVDPDGVAIIYVAPRHRTRSADWIWLLSRTISMAATSAPSS
jgi:hypothetical protein